MSDRWLRLDLRLPCFGAWRSPTERRRGPAQAWNEGAMTGLDQQQLDVIIANSFFKTVLRGEVTEFGDGKCGLRVFVRQPHRQFLSAVHGGIVGALADD